MIRFLAGFLTVPLLAALVLAVTPGPETGPFPGPLAAGVRAVVQRAAAGDTAAQRQIAGWLWHGTHGPADRVRAAEYYQQAAAAGDALALHEHGANLVAAEPAAGLALIEQAAQAGVLEAQLFLAMRLDASSDPDRDRKAAEWYLRAAEQGDLHAQVMAGLMLLHGRGVEQDAAAAYGWFDRAARAGAANAQRELAAVLAAGAGVSADPLRALVWATLESEGGAEGAAALRDSQSAALTEEDRARAAEMIRACHAGGLASCG